MPEKGRGGAFLYLDLVPKPNFLPAYRDMNGETTPEEEKRYAELQQMALDFARNGGTEGLQPMVEAGLPVNLSDHKGNTLLMLAAYNGQAETARMLLEHDAKVDQRNDRGQTPLGGVAFKGDVKLARLLLEAGAEIDADNGGGMTPLMYATLFGRTEVADFLRGAGATMGRRKNLGRVARLFTRLAAAVQRFRRKRS